MLAVCFALEIKMIMYVFGWIFFSCSHTSVHGETPLKLWSYFFLL